VLVEQEQLLQVAQQQQTLQAVAVVLAAQVLTVLAVTVVQE